MHQLQQKILKLSKRTDISKMGLHQIGRFVEEGHPQKIKHHLAQLEKKGLIYRDKKTGFINVIDPGKIKKTKLFSLPIVGSANCGPAEILAHENIEGFLRVSSKMIERSNPRGLFILKAVGDSLDRAENIKGGEVEDGDFVVIDGNNHSPDDGQYILSVIDDMANLKRYYRDKNTGQIVLMSESSIDIPPIYIHPSDFSDYIINGTILRVIKKLKLNN